MGSVQVTVGSQQATATYTVQAPTTATAGVTKDGQGRASWKMVRTYNNGDALQVPTSMRFATNYKSVVSPGWRNVPASVTQITNLVHALPDRPGLRVCAYHEPEDNYGRTTAGAANLSADESKFAQIVRAENLTRTNPLTIFRCIMGYSLDSPGSAGVDPAAWFVGDYDEVGIDVYSNKAIQLAIDFAARMGKPLCVPEMGPLTNIDHTDPAILTYMQNGLPKFKAAGATWVCWFDKAGSGGDLDQYPNSLAYWKTQI